ncbi:MAG: glycosyltransferase [Clostridia bacterium]|nr:glycosyltransferase [Clostridia bacterium]
MKKISIVTPSFNGANFLERCIKSIMGQTYQNFEHIIVDGGSTDETLSILKRYEGQYNMRWISEKDEGMYDAICKGFSIADGEIFAWLNTDDIYMPWTLQIIAEVFENDKYQWCTASQSSYITGDGKFYFRTRTVGPKSYSRKNIARGYHDGRILPFIQQESTFWTRKLWEKSGGVDKSYRLAGDFYLWKTFAEYEPLYTLNTVLAAFCVHKGQLSSNADAYMLELPKLSLNGKILHKTRLLFLYLNIFHPYHGNLIQIEEIINGNYE